MREDKTLIGLVLFPQATQLDLTAPFEVFARIPGVSVRIVAANLEPVVTDRGLRIVPDTTYNDCPELNVLFIPGGPGQITAESDTALMSLIEAYGQKPKTIVSSVCTGALLLGAAGLLQGKRATTHWTCMHILPYYGATPTDTPVVDEGRIITGAGVVNGIDLALHIAEKLRNRDVVQRIGRQIEYPHASTYTDKTRIDQLSRQLMADNSLLPARIEAAKQAAQRLKTPRASDIKRVS